MSGRNNWARLETERKMRHPDVVLRSPKDKKPAVSRFGDLDPTAKQLRLLERLAEELGRPMPKPTTRRGASLSIERLLAIKQQNG